ncbi:ewing's tumor-associated antigen 1 isoform X1 [Eubalaena glacialis]|uniref:ewing's tumor-associated antigen 1 isoform X1 n=1 Tax=Eubalaena glacialis TaxID=27606 RepID=UPI002A5AD56E|nr:ewing's tumor-associated antigen 1 isoform X1 [Eubalaena glacialis]XP_061067138.1 ewing's tumor-associated antigen 1 isoform X1 [Eubalaena glacialis]
MSRRRKYGDSPGLKNTPRKAAATEECSSVVETGKRRLRSARGSGPCGAGERPPRPLPQQEQPPVAASCSKSNPEGETWAGGPPWASAPQLQKPARDRETPGAEMYETPKRMLQMDLLSSTFSSPNDPDGQNDIFWDQNSPMTKQLGKGRKKQTYTTDSDEISHIVKRIAPQDEKPTTDSMLGVWIGATAIPCTPSVAKGKSRAKLSCTKLKSQNQEEELMKLAKQFDKNMEELDVIQEQNKRNHDLIQMISEAETLNNYRDSVQTQLLHDIVPEIDNAMIKKPVKENRIFVVNDQNSSQKPFDQNAEAAFIAIFDGSTQKCSGRLSQDLSAAFLNTSNTTFGKKNALKEENIITNETLVTEKLPNKTEGSLSRQVDNPGMTKSHVTSCTKEPGAFNKHIDTFTTSDFEDDWENLLNNEPFVMQNIEMSELFPAPETAQITDQKEICTFNSKNGKSKSGMNTSLDTRLRDSKILQDLPSKTWNSELTDAAKYRFSPKPNDKPNKLSSTGNKMKLEKSFNTVVVQDKIQDCAVASNLAKVNEDTHIKFTSNVNASEKKSTLNPGCSNEQKNKSIFNQSLKAPTNVEPLGSATLGNKTSVCNPNQTNASKLSSFFDDWNDTSFTNEIVKACHHLENTWEADDVDDDLLYQACDDIERLTQEQDIRVDSKTSESVLGINNSSKHGAKNVFTTPKQGSQLVQSKRLNLNSVSVQTSSLTDSLQINKSMKTEKREICGNSPGFLGATTNLTIYSKNSNCRINNLHVSWNNTDVPKQVNSSKSVLTGSSSLNVSSDHMSTEIAANKKKLSTPHLSHSTVTDEAQSDLNRTVRFSKYTFIKMKNSQILSQFNNNCITGSISGTRITQGLQKNKTVNPLCGNAVQQQSSVKFSESLKQTSKEEEEKNRKYSPEEIQRKRQEALVRRMAKAQASSVKKDSSHLT